jgi:hypothetical protein
VKVELILPNVRTHSENMTWQISRGEGHVHRNCGRLHAWAVVPAEQFGTHPQQCFHCDLASLSLAGFGFPVEWSNSY